MLSSKFKDNKHRKLYSNVESLRLINKLIFVNALNRKLTKRQHSFVKYKFYRRFNKLKYRVFTKLLNKCIITNRNTRTFSEYKLSRLKIKEFLSFGILSGYRKSIW